MQSLVKSTYTEAEVIKALEASGRSVKFRYELLDQNLTHKGWLDSVESGKVENNHMAQVKRVGNFTMRSQNVWDINFLIDRIRPWFDLRMISGQQDVTVEIPPDPYEQVVLSKNPVGYWRLGETSGTVAADSSGNGNTATWGVIPGRTDGLIAADPDGAVSLASGAGQHATVPSAGVADTGASLSAEAWYLPTALPPANTAPCFIAEQYPTGPSVRFALGFDAVTGKVFVGFFDGSWRKSIAPTVAVVGEAEHWAGTYDGQMLRLYRNGTEVASSGPHNVPAPPTGGGEWRIGKRWDGNEFLDGTLDEVALYDRALSATEVLENYKAGKGTLRKFQMMQQTTYEWISWPLGTFLMETSSELTNTEGTKRSVKGFDQLLILKEDSFTNRYSIPKNVSIRDKVIEIIESAGILNHSISASGALTPFALEWPIGTPKLEVVNELLRAMGFGSLLFTAAGVAAAQPWQSALDKGPQYEYLAKIISPDVEVRLDLARVPNQWVGYTSSSDGPSLRSVFTNTNPNSFTSTVNRGRVVSAAPIRATAADQAALDTIVRQKAEADSQIYQETSFTSVKMPHHGDGDILRLKADHAFVDFVAQEKSWGMDLEAGGVMEHTIQRLITL